jgi:hypothetical protein
VVCSDQKEVESAFLSYFKNLFYAQRLEGLVGCLSGIKRTITPAMNTALLQPCTMEEVSIALLNMGLLSLSGPDGFNAAFFQQNWGSIGEEVCRTIANFIRVGYMDEDINFTRTVSRSRFENVN